MTVKSSRVMLKVRVQNHRKVPVRLPKRPLKIGMKFSQLPRRKDGEQNLTRNSLPSVLPLHLLFISIFLKKDVTTVMLSHFVHNDGDTTHEEEEEEGILQVHHVTENTGYRKWFVIFFVLGIYKLLFILTVRSKCKEVIRWLRLDK